MSNPKPGTQMPTLLKLCTVLMALYLGNLECYTGDQELFFCIPGESLGVVGNHCRFAFVVLCGYSTFSFQFVYLLRHLVIALICNTKKLPLRGTLLLAARAGHCSSE